MSKQLLSIAWETEALHLKGISHHKYIPQPTTMPEWLGEQWQRTNCRFLLQGKKQGVLDLPLHCLLQRVFACTLLQWKEDRPPCYLIKFWTFIMKEQGTHRWHTLYPSSLTGQYKIIHKIKWLGLASTTIQYEFLNLIMITKMLSSASLDVKAFYQNH